MASEGDSSSTTSIESDDPGWLYNNLEEDDGITCLFCYKVTRKGIHGAKLHQIKACSFCPEDVKDKLNVLVKKHKSKKIVVAEDGVAKMPKIEKKRSGVYIGGQEKRLKSNANGPHSNLEATSLKQTNMNDACENELRARTVQAIARFFCEAGVAFNVARLDCFNEMIELIGNYGPNLKPPSYHELRGPLLKNEVDNVNKWIKVHEDEWSKYGCSIMLDGWAAREQRTSVNILVNSFTGTVFMESVDASSYTESVSEMCRLLNSFVERIGEANAVQVITDSGSNSVLAGKMLMETRPNLFWTPCAAHCIDLMLEDIGNLAKVKKTIKRGIFLVGYIYNRCGVLNMMREFTNNKELTRNGITRFVTTYLSLQSLYKQKGSLERMFISEKWRLSVWAKEAKGKTAKKLVYTLPFWNNVVWTLKVTGPLVRALRLVKNEKKPGMGYIHKAMDTAKEAIRSAFDKENDCKVVYDIIDKRWDCQRHHPLHVAGYYFNPEFYCTNPDIEKDSAVMKGLTACVQKLVPSNAEQDLIMTELIKWVNQAGHFGNDLAIRARGKIAPADWWKLYGKETPNLQKFAVKVLSLACSSSCCERNWGSFEHINSKKMNQLEHKKLQNLVFVKYNRTFKNRHDKDVYDSIYLKGTDYSNEWLTGKMEENRVLENEDLTRVGVANASLEDEEQFSYLSDIEDETLVDWFGDFDDDVEVEDYIDEVDF
ncbi:putative HAT dimerization domain, ribonuclease H-like superfamily [Helianthus annuus]|nr:putative HAT dimerization domain, ribonuclease H-like superfamily [Helianthus annuus]KAJ0866375.1 putative HAT dimerization domain, ribonuclease H-like superfamily [Helianthus annuus]